MFVLVLVFSRHSIQFRGSGGNSNGLPSVLIGYTNRVVSMSRSNEGEVEIRTKLWL